MKGLSTILLLVVSNIFMTFAWYGHLKLQEMKVISNWPLYAVILFSTLIVFTVFTTVFFKGEALHWNHFAAFCCLILAVYFVFMK